MMAKIFSYPKSVFGGLLCIPWTIFWSSAAVVFIPFLENRNWLGNGVTYFWSKGLLFLLNVKLEIEGTENISKESGIFIFNHSSHFDIPIILAVLEWKTARFGSKAELFDIPIFGQGMKALGVLKIHRSHRDKVIKLYKKSLKNLSKGFSYVLAPEGTRQEAVELGKFAKFKSGPFVMAIVGQCPLFPIVISGADQVMPKGTIFPAWGIWRPVVRVKILPAISTVSETLDNRTEFISKVQKTMEEAQG